MLKLLKMLFGKIYKHLKTNRLTVEVSNGANLDIIHLFRHRTL